METGPYARAAWVYREAGWPGVLPLPPARKGPPPGGFTGWAGIDPSGADVQAWCDGPEGVGNIALRLPAGVYGLDVDAYIGKTGAASLAELVELLGPVPPTWIITSREDGVSGIRLYRAPLPAGRHWRDEPGGHGGGIEAIHVGHRYAVTAPSVHPDTGAEYRIIGPDGLPASRVPRVDELPVLPESWTAGLSDAGEASTADAASHAETLNAVTAYPVGEACPRVTAASARGLGRLRDASDGAALHPAGRDATMELISLGHDGHVGTRRALAEHSSAFIAVRVARGGDQGAAEAEWWRMVRGAVGKTIGPPRETCDCALLAGDGVQFEWAPTPIADSITEPPEVGRHRAENLVGPLAERLLSPAQVRALPPPVTVVDGLLTMDSESWLIASAGSYKTFVALDMAAHVAAGKPWMGRGVKGGPVLYLLAEGVGGLGKRVRAWEQRNGPMSEDVHFLTVPVQVGQDEQWMALVDLARQLRPVMVVLDTQARLTVGLKENDNTEMGMFVHAVGKLRRACGGCILVVHHLGRNGQDARGASAIDGAQDSELKITRTADKRVVLVTDKQRHLPDDVRIELELFECELDDGGTSLVVGPPLTAASIEKPWCEGLPENQALIMDILHEQFSEHGGTQSQVAMVLRERGQSGAARYVKSSFYKAWNSLLSKDKIQQIHGTQRFVPVPENEGQA